MRCSSEVNPQEKTPISPLFAMMATPNKHLLPRQNSNLMLEGMSYEFLVFLVLILVNHPRPIQANSP